MLLNVLVIQYCAATWLYLVLSRSGPNTAPRAHMGRPVWAASNHFTATSPEISSGATRQKYLGYMKCIQRGKQEEVNSQVCWNKLMFWQRGYKPLLPCLQITGRQNQSTRLIRAKIMTDWSTFINKWLAMAAGEENIKEIWLRPWSRMQGEF